MKEVGGLSLGEYFVFSLHKKVENYKLLLINHCNDMNNTSLSDIIRLSISERLQLVEDIWDSITAIPGAIPLTDEQKKELDRRLLEYKLQSGTGIPWDKVKEKIQSLK